LGSMEFLLWRERAQLKRGVTARGERRLGSGFHEKKPPPVRGGESPPRLKKKKKGGAGNRYRGGGHGGRTRGLVQNWEHGRTEPQGKRKAVHADTGVKKT